MASMSGLLLTLVVTTLAVFERAAQVAAGQLGLPFPILLAVLVAAWTGLLIALLALRRRALAWAGERPRWTIRVALASWLIALLAFAWLYPVVDSGRLGFESDREEAIDVAVRALARGEFPYACRAVSGVHDGCPETGNPIGPWPGAFALSAPVVWVFGSAGWYSLLCLPFGVWMLTRLTRDPPTAVLAAAALTLAAPIIPAELITGGDLLANTLLVLGPLALLVQDPRRRGALALAILLGVALSWRGLLFMVVPPVLASFAARGRYRDLVRVGGTALAAFAAVTLPLVLWSPETFTPWQVQQKLTLFTAILPHADRLFPLLGAGVGLVLGWRARTPAAVLDACGWAVVVPVLGAVVLYSIDRGFPSCTFYGWYALAALPIFATAAVVRSVAKPDCIGNQEQGNE